MIDKFMKRMEKIGIELELSGNYPWVYLKKIQGQVVTEKYMANHGFTIFMLQMDNSFKMMDRKKVFSLIRSYKEVV